LKGSEENAHVHLICDLDEWVWPQHLVSAVSDPGNIRVGGAGRQEDEKGAVVEMQVTDRYYRAIARIDFHYFLTKGYSEVNCNSLN
jgi:hypothetical protein